MNVQLTPIEGLAVAGTTPFRDHRGLFYRAFCDMELAQVLGPRRIRQVNVSRTTTVGAIRGLHFQFPPHSEMKLVRCLRGRVWDVAVDLRRNSPTFLQWHAETLSEDNALMAIIPEGCAHGFQVLQPASELLYLHTALYEPASESGVRHDDPMLNILWPLPPLDISPRDATHAYLTRDFKGFDL